MAKSNLALEPTPSIQEPSSTKDVTGGGDMGTVLMSHSWEGRHGDGSHVPFLGTLGPEPNQEISITSCKTMEIYVLLYFCGTEEPSLCSPIAIVGG
jgi:hypothetical protein